MYAQAAAAAEAATQVSSLCNRHFKYAFISFYFQFLGVGLPIFSSDQEFIGSKIFYSMIRITYKKNTHKDRLDIRSVNILSNIYLS